MARAEITAEFIDESRRLIAAVQAKDRRILTQTGRFGATTIRRGFKRRRGPSAPGRPPHAHKPGSQGLKDVRYVVLPGGSVIMGPVKHQSRTFSKPVPQLLDEGGRVRTRGQEHNTTSVARIKPRPYRTRAYEPTKTFLITRLQHERL